MTQGYPNWFVRAAEAFDDFTGDQNDFSPPTPRNHSVPADYKDIFDKIDPSKPIGVFLFHVPADKDSTIDQMIVYASRNNFIREMEKSYGKDNLIVLDDMTNAELDDFSKQFNDKFRKNKQQVHFLANHHQGAKYHYTDEELAKFLESIEWVHKRAIILSCGPESKKYHNLRGFDYVLIPRPDENTIFAEISTGISPAYRYTIPWMKDVSNPQGIEKKFLERTINDPTIAVLEYKRDKFAAAYGGATYKPPIVIAGELETVQLTV